VLRLLSAAADITLVLDAAGIIRDIAYGHNDLPQCGTADWVGKAFVDTVSAEGRPKVEDMLREGAAQGAARPREVTQAGEGGQSLPIRYTLVRSGTTDRLLALGHDLRLVGRLQQRLVETQMTLDAETARQRHADQRYRAIFQSSTDALILVDTNGQRVVDANPAALAGLGGTAGSIVGAPVAQLFTVASQQAVVDHLFGLRSSGRSMAADAALASDGRPARLSSSLIRQGKSVLALMRVETPGSGRAPDDSLLPAVARDLPEAVVVTDRNQIALEGNAAFLALAGLGAEGQLRGHPLSRWLGRQSVDTGVLLTNLREHGLVRDFATVLRGEHGSEEEVEITASALDGAQPATHVFIIRKARAIHRNDADGKAELPHSVQRMIDLVGRVPLKELVRDTTDVIEKLCIEAALKLTGDNRASAAQMLGLSRQSLYAKLRRYGIDDNGEGEEG
jgi:transcriptional regulator PpsR